MGLASTACTRSDCAPVEIEPQASVRCHKASSAWQYSTLHSAADEPSQKLVTLPSSLKLSLQQNQHTSTHFSHLLSCDESTPLDSTLPSDNITSFLCKKINCCPATTAFGLSLPTHMLPLEVEVQPLLAAFPAGSLPARCTASQGGSLNAAKFLVNWHSRISFRRGKVQNLL